MMNVKKILNSVVLLIAALALALALAIFAGCKSINVEKIERVPHLDGTNVIAWTENKVRGSYWVYGLKNEVEGLSIKAKKDEGFSLDLNKAGSDMSDKHEKIVEKTGSAVGSAIGAAAAAAAL